MRHCILTSKWSDLLCKQYLPIHHKLTAVGCVILRDTRIMIPQALCNQVLSLAHEGYPGIVVMKRHLRSKCGGQIWTVTLKNFANRVLGVN